MATDLEEEKDTAMFSLLLFYLKTTVAKTHSLKTASYKNVMSSDVQEYDRIIDVHKREREQKKGNLHLGR